MTGVPDGVGWPFFCLKKRGLGGLFFKRGLGGFLDCS